MGGTRRHRTAVTAAVIAVLLVFCVLTASCGRRSSDSESAAPAETVSETDTADSSSETGSSVAVTTSADDTDAESSSVEDASGQDEAGSGQEALIAEPVPDDEKKNGYTVVIDPGHTALQDGKYVPIGPGASETKIGDAVGTHGDASGLAEYELTLVVSKLLARELEDRGYTVLLTHDTNDVAINCDARANVANDAEADCFVRIHADGAADTSAKGALAICITPSNPWTADTYKESRRLSDCILKAYCEGTGMKDRGVLEEDNMTGNNWAKMPATLLELGFMTNPEEDLWMADPENQDVMAVSIADGIDDYFAISTSL